MGAEAARPRPALNNWKCAANHMSVKVRYADRWIRRGRHTMAAAPIRLLGAAAWPLTVWSSLARLEEHPIDDYVERTSPIVASAVAFWLCAALLVFAMSMSGG